MNRFSSVYLFFNHVPPLTPEMARPGPHYSIPHKPHPSGERHFGLVTDVYHQFKAEVHSEVARLQEKGNQGVFGRAPVNFERLANEIVRDKWRRRGIWNENWVDLTMAPWGHADSDEGRGDKFDREASRPYRQFQAQVLEEQQSLEDNDRQTRLTSTGTTDRAARIVRERWWRRKIFAFDRDGEFWAHEADLARRKPKRTSAIRREQPKSDGIPQNHTVPRRSERIANLQKRARAASHTNVPSSAAAHTVRRARNGKVSKRRATRRKLGGTS
jgi:hypothetical protein